MIPNLCSFTCVVASLLVLSACQAVPTPTGKPVDVTVPVVPAVPVTPVTVSPLSANEQIDILKSRVALLEMQMKSAEPTLKKMDVIETHFKALSFELGQITENYKIPTTPVVDSVATPVQPPVIAKPVVPVVAKPQSAPKPMPGKKPEKKGAQPHPANNGPLAVTSVRIGDQTKNVTRIVFDTTKAAEIHYDLDNSEGLLVIDIPGAKWSAKASADFAKAAIVKSFRATSDENGAQFVANLSQTAKVVTTARLMPSGASGHRVYVDISPAK